MSSPLTVLHLQRYGALADVELPLGAGLTVVVGPNEAGKSTTRLALGDLLWGLPLRSPLHALVPRGQVRLMADLEDGTRLVRTAKGLLARDGLTPLPPSAHPWGADDEEHRRAWATSFGLDHTALRAGGQAVCRGEGDLAELVFTAREGHGVHELLEALEERASALYKEHRGNRGVAVRRALAEHQAAREELAAATTRASRVVEAEARVEELREAVEAAGRAEVETEREHARRALQQRCADDAARLRAARVRAARLHAEGPVLPAGDLAAWVAATADLLAARGARSALALEVARWREEQGELVSEPALLADGGAVEALAQLAQARHGDAARAVALAERAGAHEEAAREALGALTAVGAEPLRVLLGALRVPADLAAQLDDAAGHRPALAAAVTSGADLVRSARAARAAAEADGELPDPALVAPVAEALELLDAQGSPAARWRAAREGAAAAGARRRGHLVEAGALDPDGPVPPVPAAGAVLAAVDALGRAAGQVRDLERDEREALGQVTAAQGALGEVVVPDVDPAAVAALRAARDALGAQVREALAGRPSGDPATLGAAHAAAVAAADVGADDLLAAAEQAALAAARRRELARCTDELRAVGAALGPARAAAAAAQGSSDALWAAAGVVPPPPARAEVVRRALVAAADADAAALEEGGRAERAGAELGSWAQRLGGLLTAAGRARPPAAGDAGAGDAAAVEAVVGAARALVEEADRHREARVRRADAAEALASAERELAAAERALDGWQARWAALVGAAGLPAVLEPTGWCSRRDLLAAAAGELAAAEQLRAEAGAAQAAWAGFSEAAVDLAARHDAPVAGGEPGQVLAAVTALWARVSRARSDARAFEDRATSLREAAATDERLGEQEAGAAAVLARLRDRHGLAEGPGAEEAVQRSEAVSELRAQEAAALDRMAAAAGPETDVEELAASLDGLDAPQLAQLARGAQEAAAAARTARDAAVAALATAEARLAELTRGRSAAALRAVEQERLAALAEVAERYAVTHLQRTVLTEQLQAYAARHASPLLHEGGRLLERLTDGRWVGVAAVGGATARALEVVDACGEHHRTAELSEGTADQVFLALRLAGLRQMQEQRVRAGRAALPVVLDDTLMTFDDARTGRALRVVADLGLQVLVLTHHDHVGRLAEGLRRPDVAVARIGGPARADGAVDAQVVRAALDVRPAAAPAVQLGVQEQLAVPL